MIKISANLGFLWQELDLRRAIKTAADYGFDAVECHWPFDTPAKDIKKSLEEADVPLLGLNTRRGDVSAGEFGISAVPGRESRARAYIDEAVIYAAESDCRNIHVMAGITDGSNAAWRTYKENLGYACEKALSRGLNILIEPINHRDAPGYHLFRLEDAVRTVDELGFSNLKIMFDCYHTQIIQGDILRNIQNNLDYIGHIQIASVPERSEPDKGELNYSEILSEIDKMGYTGFIGAEYRPKGSTEQGLTWLNKFKTPL